jgi:hypothetical protein
MGTCTFCLSVVAHFILERGEIKVKCKAFHRKVFTTGVTYNCFDNKLKEISQSFPLLRFSFQVGYTLKKEAFMGACLCR